MAQINITCQLSQNIHLQSTYYLMKLFRIILSTKNIMDSRNSNKNTEPGIFNTIRNDVQSGGHFDNIRREYRELRDFYIDTERKSRLEEMNVAKRWIFFVWWLLKSMFFKLTPTRRLLLLLGIFLSNAGFTISFDTVLVNDNGFMGGVLILFVLLLELKDKLLAHNELESGRKIQQALAPERSPNVAGWSLWLYTRPANEVGGDLVDFLKIDDDARALSWRMSPAKGFAPHCSRQNFRRRSGLSHPIIGHCRNSAVRSTPYFTATACRVFLRRYCTLRSDRTTAKYDL